MKTILATKDLPKQLVTIVQQQGFKIVDVEIGITHKVGDNWHDLNRITVMAVNTTTGEIRSENGCYADAICPTRTEAAINSGFTVTLLGPDDFVLEFSTYPKRAVVYAHPDAVSKLLPAPEDLSAWEKKALYVIKMYLAPGRYEEAKRLGMPRPIFDGLKQTLQRKGLLTAAGALTLKGKQAACNIQL